MTERLPDAAAREQALHLDRHVLVMAPAGSGKTGLLVARMLRALAAVDEPEQVVAITFTNKAAAEIRQRVVALLARARAGEAGDQPPHDAQALALARTLLQHDAARGWRLLDQPERLRALTIDRFNAQIAAQLPLLSGLGGPMRVADDAWPLYVEAILRLFAELDEPALPAELHGAIERVLRLADNRIDRLLPALTDLLARRDQWLARVVGDDDAWDAAEQAVLDELVVEGLRALHDALDAQCRDELAGLLGEGSALAEPLAWAAALRGWPPPARQNSALYRRLAAQLVTAQGQLRAARGISVQQGFPPKQPHTLRMKALLERLAGNEHCAAACRSILALPDPEYPEPLRQLKRALLAVMRRLAAHLRVVFGEAGQADFAQIAQSALAALRPEGGYGDALLAADRRIRHLLVDEMQDTSDAQIELLLQLTQGWQPGDGRSLFLVGDPQQSIYAFRKAEVRLFLQLWSERRLGSLPLTCLRLSANFRSDPAVVAWFNDAFERIFPAVADEVQGAVPFSPSQAQRAPGEGGVSVVAFAGEEENEAAAAAAAEAATRIASGSVAVLARTRSQLAPVIRTLRARGLVPACQDIDPLSTQPAVRDYIALARALWHPEDRLHWAALLRAPFVGLCWADLVVLSRGLVRESWPSRIERRAEDPALSAEGRARLARLRNALQASARELALRSSLAERSEALWHALGGPGCVGRDELADVQAAMRLLRAHTRSGGIDDLEALERGLAQLYAEPRAGQIQVMTVHKAKGLEFDHVLLVGCHRKPRGEDQPLWHFKRTRAGELLVPKPPDALDEKDPARPLYQYLHRLHVDERRNESLRLLYVAATRARCTLTLYLCAEPDAEGRLKLPPQSFAQLLAPVIAPAVLQSLAQRPAAPERVEPAAPRPPRAPRLPLDYRYEAETGLYRPQETRTLRPSESVLHAAEDKREGQDAEGDLYAQLVGTLYHQALQKIAEDGPQTWADGGASRRAALASGFRRMGLPGAQVDAAVARVLALVGRTLASSTGRWLLERKPWARNEYHIAGYREGRWVAAVIDRCFRDHDGCLWLVDYKTAARPQAPAARQASVERAVERYRAQLQLYAELLAALRPQETLRAALYFPEADRLEEVPIIVLSA